MHVKVPPVVQNLSVLHVSGRVSAAATTSFAVWVAQYVPDSCDPANVSLCCKIGIVRHFNDFRVLCQVLSIGYEKSTHFYWMLLTELGLFGGTALLTFSIAFLQ